MKCKGFSLTAFLSVCLSLALEQGVAIAMFVKE